MVQEAADNAEADQKARELIEAKNQAEGVISIVRSDMKEVTITEDEKTKVEEAITALEEAIKGNDKDVITQKISDLYAASNPIVQAKAPKEDKPQDPNVVDAEFTETK
jgi:molecular chaperone DnaK